MIDFLIPFIAGFIITILSLIVGYKLGKDQTMVTDDTRKKIQRIFKRIVPDTELGAITRPDVQQNFYRDNPRAKLEDDVMSNTLDTLNEK